MCLCVPGDPNHYPFADLDARVLEIKKCAYRSGGGGDDDDGVWPGRNVAPEDRTARRFRGVKRESQAFLRPRLELPLESSIH